MRRRGQPGKSGAHLIQFEGDAATIIPECDNPFYAEWLLPLDDQVEDTYRLLQSHGMWWV